MSKTITLRPERTRRFGPLAATVFHPKERNGVAARRSSEMNLGLTSHEGARVSGADATEHDRTETAVARDPWPIRVHRSPGEKNAFASPHRRGNLTRTIRHREVSR